MKHHRWVICVTPAAYSIDISENPVQRRQKKSAFIIIYGLGQGVWLNNIRCVHTPRVYSIARLRLYECYNVHGGCALAAEGLYRVQ